MTLVLILLLQGAMILALLRIDRKIRRIIMTQAELAQALRDLKSNLDDDVTQLQKAFDELTAALQNQGTVSQEVQDALTALGASKDAIKNKSQALDDLTPDTPPPGP